MRKQRRGAQLSAEAKKGGIARCGSKEGWGAQLSAKAKKKGGGGGPHRYV